MKDEYTEYLLEYDNENLVVYLSGLDKDDFWEELATYDEVNNPEDFAQGLVEGLKAKGHFASVVEVVI